MNETVTITMEEYKHLLDEAEFLRALIMTGVDNWGGYDEACEIYKEWGGECK